MVYKIAGTKRTLNISFYVSYKNMNNVKLSKINFLKIKFLTMYIYRVFIAIWNKVNAFFGQKNLFLKHNYFFFLKDRSWTFMNIWKHFFKDKNLCLKKPRTLGAWNRQSGSKEGGISCSYAFLEICEVILRGRDLIFCVEPQISIYFTDIKYFFFQFGQPGACSRRSSSRIGGKSTKNS